MTNFTVWEVTADVLLYDLGLRKINYGLFSDYDEAVRKAAEVECKLTTERLKYELTISGRRVIGEKAVKK